MGVCSCFGDGVPGAGRRGKLLGRCGPYPAENRLNRCHRRCGAALFNEQYFAARLGEPPVVINRDDSLAVDFYTVGYYLIAD